MTSGAQEPSPEDVSEGYESSSEGSSESTSSSSSSQSSVTNPPLSRSSSSSSSVATITNPNSSSSSSSPPLVVDEKVSCTITANPETVNWGSPTTISWQSENSTAASLNHALGNVAVSGTQQVKTLVNGTEYTLSVTGTSGTANCSVKINVINIPPPLTSVIDFSRLALPGNPQYIKGPIVIDGKNGKTLYGKVIYNRAGPCLIIRNSSNITLSHMQFYQCGNDSTNQVALQIENSTGITVDHSLFWDSPRADAIYSVNSSHINIDHNQFYNVAGGITHQGGTALSTTYNRFQNMHQKSSGQLSGFIQYDKAYGGLNTIACNTGTNEATVVPQTGDLINIFQSAGTATSPIQVYGNKLIGSGVNLDGIGLASAGIQTGDGSNSAYIRVFFNQLVNIDSGIQVTGGDTIEVSYNQVYAGGRSGYYTSGMSAVNFYGATNQSWAIPGAFCRNINIHNNTISMAEDSHSRATMFDYSIYNDWPNCINLTATNNDVHTILDSSIINNNPAPGCSEN